MMRINSAVLTCVVTFVAVAAYADENTVGSRQKSYTVDYGNGNKEIYVVKYRAVVSNSKSEDGHPSEPLKGRPTDTRQCHWNIETSIVRDVCLVSASGQQFCQGSLTRVYGTSFSGKGSDFKVLALRPENCGDADARYRSDLNNAQNNVQSALSGVADNDVKIVEADLMTTTRAASVKPDAE
jgi:hypothetical protein